jgi:DnaK suppressor protein
MPLTAARRKKLQQKLVDLRTELTSRAPESIQPNRTDEAEIGGDEDEQPLNEMLQAIASSRNRNREVLLKQVERALKKLRNEPDEFGLCVQCEEEIPFPRLKALHYAELCVECQSKRDAARGGPTRKKLTEYV